MIKTYSIFTEHLKTCLLDLKWCKPNLEPDLTENGRYAILNTFSFHSSNKVVNFSKSELDLQHLISKIIIFFKPKIFLNLCSCNGVIC